MSRLPLTLAWGPYDRTEALRTAVVLRTTRSATDVPIAQEERP